MGHEIYMKHYVRHLYQLCYIQRRKLARVENSKTRGIVVGMKRGRGNTHTRKRQGVRHHTKTRILTVSDSWALFFSS